MHRYLRLILFCLLTPPSALFTQVVTIPVHQYGLDPSRQLIVCRANLEAFNTTEGTFTQLLADTLLFTFVDETGELRYGEHYEMLSAGGTPYRLYFTELPLIHLNPYNGIGDEEKRPADFTYADDEQVLTAISGVEIRGGYTAQLPKKTYDLEFWTDASGDESVDASFRDFRDDDDWILDAVYNEPLRVNAFVAHQLWLDAYHLPYAADEPDALPGPQVSWCEVFRDGNYDGLYFLSEQVDRKQLKLKKFDQNNDRLRGELYKTDRNTLDNAFIDLSSPPSEMRENWKGFEAKYPNEDFARWGTLYQMLDFAINSDDASFEAGLDEWFDVENIADFFLFINLTGAADNTRKNVYYARYDDDEPFLFPPWDLDGTFGNHWDGTDAPYNRDSIISNELFDRMIRLNAGGFNDVLCDRFITLEASGIYDIDNISDRIRGQYAMLDHNGVYEREGERWPGSLRATEDDLDYSLNWTAGRFAFLEQWFCDMTVPTEAPSSTTDQHLYPNPTFGIVQLMNVPSGTADWTLFDLAGQQLLSGRLSFGQTTLDLHGPAPGMYLLRVGGATHKLLIR